MKNVKCIFEAIDSETGEVIASTEYEDCLESAEKAFEDLSDDVIETIEKEEK